MPKIQTLDQLLVHEIADLMSAEEQLVDALPKMAEAATGKDLKAGLLNHLQETVAQLQRLQDIAVSLGMMAKDKAICKAMKGLVAEGQECLKETPAGPVRDLAIIGASQRVEHYEMAAYRGAINMATQLGQLDVAELLEQTLKEEAASDQLLSQVAEATIPKALSATK